MIFILKLTLQVLGQCFDFVVIRYDCLVDTGATIGLQLDWRETWHGGFGKERLGRETNIPWNFRKIICNRV